ncbi:MAG: PASTA domain-containing protein [Ignavibacteriales bacterium]|nr:PASTA domain-containing protein [Ignavibacteriales bacterium]
MKQSFFSRLINHPATKKFGIITGSLVVFLLLLNYLIMPWYVNSAVVVVPQLAGLSIEEATAKVDEVGLNLVIGGTIFDNDTKKGIVLRQRPFPRDEVKKGRSVYLFVSGGKPVVTIPSLVGQTVSQAKLLLARNDLKIGEVTYVPSSIGEGKIVSQEQLAGSTITFGARIAVQVSAGMESGSIEIPDLSRLSLSEAEQALKDLGLEVGKIEYKAVQDFLPGTVIDQNPTAGKKLNAGEKVDIIIAKDAQPVTD